MVDPDWVIFAEAGLNDIDKSSVITGRIIEWEMNPLLTAILTVLFPTEEGAIPKGSVAKVARETVSVDKCALRLEGAMASTRSTPVNPLRLFRVMSNEFP